VPVLCATMRSAVSLGLSKAADTSSALTATIQVIESADNFLPARYRDMVDVAGGMGWFPSLWPSSGGRVIASASSATSGTVVYKPVFFFYLKGDLLVTGKAAAAPRMMFPAMEPGASLPPYTQAWWDMLKSAVVRMAPK
jgi:hypothetical protein